MNISATLTRIIKDEDLGSMYQVHIHCARVSALPVLLSTWYSVAACVVVL